MLGAEGPGLSRLVRERCDTIASIPMAGVLDSLNVSNAAAVSVYEITRRRAEATGGNCARDRDRTCDLLFTRQLLYQLSYPGKGRESDRLT